MALVQMATVEEAIEALIVSPRGDEILPPPPLPPTPAHSFTLLCISQPSLNFRYFQPLIYFLVLIEFVYKTHISLYLCYCTLYTDLVKLKVKFCKQTRINLR